MQARHGPLRSFGLGEHYGIHVKIGISDGPGSLSLTLFRRAQHLTHEFRVRVKLVSALSAGVLKGVRLTTGLRTSTRARGEGLGAILDSRGLGERVP